MSANISGAHKLILTFSDKASIQTSIVSHLQSSLARAAFNADQLAIYQATALSLRDRLLKSWNETQVFHTQKKPKRVYYLSLEFLMGRALDNALLNLGLKKEYSEAIEALGFRLEDLLEYERDAGLGNGGLGRLASCYMDSLSTTGIPAWGYGLRYQYGIFQQLLNERGQQLEVPDPWLDNSNPWEIPRLDTAVEVRFYGEAIRPAVGKSKGRWTGGQIVLAVPYDLPIPGFDTKNMNNIRLWSSKPKRAFDLNSFNSGDYDRAVQEAEEAENITRVLYPNDNFEAGKELRLKQQYFWCAASFSDIVRRFKKINAPWSEFPNHAAIQLNDTHPTICIVECMRVLCDEEELAWDDAWDITRATFGYTNHTVLPEALEKWSAPLMQRLLPRHMQIIYDINLFWLQRVEKAYSGDIGRLERMSLIQEGFPQYVRMANLAVIGSHKVNGVAELHSGLVKEMFQDFLEFLPDHFTNVTNGITPRRWLLQCNPALSNLITEVFEGSKDWLKDLYKLKGLEKFAKDPEFQRKFREIKLNNKQRLANYINETRGVKINSEALFDIQVKRIHEYKRQFMNILGCIYRYCKLRSMTPEEREKVVPRVSIFAGKAAPGYFIAKLVIQLINNVAKVVNNDKTIGDSFKVVFLPDYSVSLAELIVPASDISQHISTAGTEASGTSNMKFALNGGLLLGTVDGATVEIAEEVGDDQVFFFGNLAADVPNLRHENYYHGFNIVPELSEAIREIQAGTFGDPGELAPLISLITEGKDYYLINPDFQSYIKAQSMIDEAWVNKSDWTEKAILTTARMGKFSSDRCVTQYAEEM
ncbi:putative glycogen phosphorylase [Phakopsora pachyrhizi]|uniref:Alpha-1,4 glucan phosphorylase n=1 Tax=Phakopsora pachyrhizi TaxID=170000 RepID=A0AAV0BEB4_PHAPC|nr:putative glycogen phosphorylase [Phakopsora pachyrhizi]CAH7685569.1 putative glycogen phosphorylase [Phakopsora pachyrhizi]